MINRKRGEKACKQQSTIRKQWVDDNRAIAEALETLSWKQVYTLEGATPYQMQTVAKLKLRRLRLWTGPENRFMCSNAECRTEAFQGRGHMVCTCPEAQKLWKQQVIYGADSIEPDVETWDHLYNTAAKLWALSCAVTLTVIWRLNVDRVHGNGSKQLIFGWRSQVRDAISRYMSNLYPLTATTKYLIAITAALLNRTFDEQISPMDTDSSYTNIYNFTRIGFFDGGSRGNPGPGGSGSVGIKRNEMHRTCSPLWAAATALGNPRTTNNVAEFVGLHMLLTEAKAKGSKDVHVVGDSAMMIGLMTRRKEPKAKKLKHWYRLTQRLADQYDVHSWTHQ
ncbi:unnamed protein product [Phytophthora lilii]|uniref:Unnamed protein product n=1 Tax=Phytophthora lilii TaxID=2077276 RepID=A0A9W6XEF1_9STRA|nr:unnamed protein product [Phytophthora lilii]